MEGFKIDQPRPGEERDYVYLACKLPKVHFRYVKMRGPIFIGSS